MVYVADDHRELTANFFPCFKVKIRSEIIGPDFFFSSRARVCFSRFDFCFAVAILIFLGSVHWHC